MNEEQSDQLYKLFYTPSSPAAFSSPENLYREISKTNPSITLKQINDWLRSQYTYTLHRQSVDKFKRNKILVDREGRQWQADLVDMKEYSFRNKGYQYLLNCVDVFSRKAWSVPLKDKSSKAVREAFEKLFKAGHHPDFLQTDQGREFLGLKSLLDAYGIRHFYARDQNIKCAMVERFNRTFRGRMFKLFTARGKYVYHDVLQELVNGYNASYHRSIGMAPNDVNKQTRERVFRKLYGTKDIYEYQIKLDLEKKRKMKRKQINDLSVDDSVRIRHPKQTAFMKKYYPIWRDRIFKVKQIIRSEKEPLYKLDIDAPGTTPSFYKRRGLYRPEVQKVDPDTYRVNKIIRRDPANNRVLVSWIDYPSEYNSWITEEEMDRVQNLMDRR